MDNQQVSQVPEVPETARRMIELYYPSARIQPRPADVQGRASFSYVPVIPEEKFNMDPDEAAAVIIEIVTNLENWMSMYLNAQFSFDRYKSREELRELRNRWKNVQTYAERFRKAATLNPSLDNAQDLLSIADGMHMHYINAMSNISEYLSGKMSIGKFQREMNDASKAVQKAASWYTRAAIAGGIAVSSIVGFSKGYKWYEDIPGYLDKTESFAVSRASAMAAQSFNMSMQALKNMTKIATSSSAATESAVMDMVDVVQSSTTGPLNAMINMTMDEAPVLVSEMAARDPQTPVLVVMRNAWSVLVEWISECILIVVEDIRYGRMSPSTMYGLIIVAMICMLIGATVIEFYVRQKKKFGEKIASMITFHQSRFPRASTTTTTYQMRQMRQTGRYRPRRRHHRS